MLPLSKSAAIEHIIGGPRMDVSDQGVTFLSKREGFSPYLYDDGGRRGAGNTTVGIGILVHMGPYHDRGICAACDEWPRKTDPPSQWLTSQDGKRLLYDKMHATGRFKGGQNYVGAVQAVFARGCTQHQFDAAVSYVYNYGTGAAGRLATAHYSGGDMYAFFTDKRYLLPLWAYDGLKSRRIAEYEMWIAPDDGTATFFFAGGFKESTEDEMKTTRVWCAERGQTWLLSGCVAVPVVSAADDAVFEKLYGPHAAVLTGAQLDAMAPK